MIGSMDFQRTVCSRQVRALAFVGLALLATGARSGFARSGSSEAGTPSGPIPVRCVEEWRIGDDDSEVFFGCVADVHFDEQGRIYALDSALSQVNVFSPAGSWLGTVCREGDGPGEIRRAVALSGLGADLLGVVQESPGRIVVIRDDGTPQPNLLLNRPEEGAAFFKLYDCAHNERGTVLVGEEIVRTPEGRRNTSFLALMDGAGQTCRRLFESPYVFDFSHFVFDEDRRNGFDFNKMAVDDSGRIYLAPSRTEYVIHVFSPAGDPLRVIRRDFERRRRHEEDVQDLQAGLERALRRFADAEVRISDYLPAIEEISIGPDGNLWVLAGRDPTRLDEGSFALWDVFDGNGEFLETREVKCDGDPGQDRLIWGPDGQAVLVTNFRDAKRQARANSGAAMEDTAGPMMLVRYRIEMD